MRLGGFIHVNTAECRFSLMKRAVFGTHHSISEAHLSRYLAEWDFKSGTPAILPMANVLRSPSKVLRAGVSTKDTISFLDRSVSGEFSAKEHTFTLDEFRAYVMDFETAIGAFRASLGATREQLDAFAKAALSLSRNSKSSSGKPKESA